MKRDRITPADLELAAGHIIKSSIQDYLQEHQAEIAKYIMDRLGKFTVAVQHQFDRYGMEIIWRKQEELEKSLKDANLSVAGKCPECKQYVQDYSAPSGFFAPEMWETMREMGLNPATGHRKECGYRGKP